MRQCILVFGKRCRIGEKWNVNRAIYAVDVGSTRCKPGSAPNFAWVRIDPAEPGNIVGSTDINRLAAYVIDDLQSGKSVALGFEAPLFIPVPLESPALCRGRKN